MDTKSMMTLGKMSTTNPEPYHSLRTMKELRRESRSILTPSRSLKAFFRAGHGR